MRKNLGLLFSLNAKKSWLSLILIGLILIVGFIPVRLAIAFVQRPIPQVILVLGGDMKRTEFASQFWRSHPNLDILVSDFRLNLASHSRVFKRAGIPENKVYYDFCATDTVTNFTCTVKYFVERNIKHLYLITSDYHLGRARAIATLVLGSRGIIVTPVSVPSSGIMRESKIRILRDCVRSVVWLVTGRTGASLNPRISTRSA